MSCNSSILNRTPREVTECASNSVYDILLNIFNSPAQVTIGEWIVFIAIFVVALVVISVTIGGVVGIVGGIYFAISEADERARERYSAEQKRAAELRQAASLDCKAKKNPRWPFFISGMAALCATVVIVGTAVDGKLSEALHVILLLIVVAALSFLVGRRRSVSQR